MMAALSNKRRKLGHTPSDDEGDDASFASFGESNGDTGAEETGMNGLAPEALDDDTGDQDTDLEDEDEDDGMEDEEDASAGASEDDNEEDAATPAQAATAVAKQTDPTRAAHQPGKNAAKDALASGGGTFISGTFKSNMFKLQVDELLEQIRPRHGKRETAAGEALHTVKKTIEQIAARPAQAIDQAERQLIKEKIAVPFPNPRPPKDAMYKLEFAKPSNINVVGSHALKIANRAADILAVDMVVQMPSALFQDKDFLNYRFFYKRAYYLACLAAGLKKAHAKYYELSYREIHDNPLHPIIVIKPKKTVTENAEKPTPKWQINILLSVDQNVFAAEKLGLDRNCIRSSGSKDGETQQPPTPFYNSSLRSNMLVTPYLKLLHQSASRCSAFRDACLLGSSWLRQRGFGSAISAGGFGNFEWAALLAVLLQGGGPGGRSILSDGYSSYQLLKATLQLLAMRDLSKQPLSVGTEGAKRSEDGIPIVWDCERAHNLLYKMAPWSYQMLRSSARTALSMLGDQQFDGFEAMFIVRSDNDLMRFDNMLEIDRSALTKGSSAQDADSQQNLATLYEVLQRGFGDRVNLMNILIDSPQPAWDFGTARPSNHSKGKVSIGLAVNMDSVSRTVDHGPSAENKAEAAAFRKFWGEKSELRRFKDGSILESLIWASGESEQSVIEQIARYLLQRHFGAAAEQSVRFTGDDFARMVRNGTTNAPFQPLSEAYKQLESDLRSLEDLPLTIRQLMPAGAQLRSTAIEAPLAARGVRQNTPANITIQFEGSSRWPDDIVAIQRTKIAFLLKFSETIDEHLEGVTTCLGLENQDTDIFNQAYLDIIYEATGASFRMRIHHEREQGLLERQLKDKSLDPRSKESAAAALAKYKRDYIKTPAHTQAISQLCTRYPALSGSMRLMKKWFASHLLSNHIAEEIIELLVARTFLQPWPWSTPSSVQTAFLRTLFFISRWDWRADPLIVDLGSSAEGSGLKQADLQAIKTRFEAWRKLDTALNRVVLFAASSVDHDGTTYTDGRPSKVVAGRMTALAKAAVAAVSTQSVDLDAASLFVSPLSDYDFVLHLNPSIAGGRKKGKKSAFKNLELDDLADTSLVGFQPVEDFLAELETLYGSAILFFHNGESVITGLWNPQTAPRSWKVNLAYSTIPAKKGKGEDAEVVAEVNKDAILAEIARLGGDMIRKIERNR